LAAVRRSQEVLDRLELVRINDRVLANAGTILPADVRSLDAIHIATAVLLGPALRRIVTYDVRMTAAARALGLVVVSPG
jgi:predicted nucleic acid-binding protein